MNSKQNQIHGVITCIAVVISLFLCTTLVVTLEYKETGIAWNIFPYILSLSVLSWMGIICGTALLMTFIIYPICEVLGACVLWLYCRFDKNSDLYDDFKIPINIGRNEHRSTSFSEHNLKFWNKPPIRNHEFHEDD